MSRKKEAAKSKCALSAGRFDGHDGAPVQNKAAVSSSAQARDAAQRVEEEERADSNQRKSDYRE